MVLNYSAETQNLLAAQKWDAIVVGSGLGGMTTACLLAKAGKKVLMLERHTVPGGFTHTFKRKGFEWDVGVHYVGQVAQPNSIIRKVFDYVSDKKLHWEPLGDIYDRVIIDGDQYDFVTGAAAQTDNLIRYFPGEEKAIRAYMVLVRSTARSAAWFIGEKTMPFWLSGFIGRFLRAKFESQAKRTTAEVLAEITTNKKLISVLCAQCGDYGLAPAKSSFGIHAIVVEHYLDGASYPIGGAGEIAKSILSVFEKNGGTTVVRADVAKILTERSRAIGVELANGAKLMAKTIVSNVGFNNTFKRLVDHETFDSKEVVKLVAPSTSHVCLYVGLDASDAALSLPKHNIWLYSQYDFDAAMTENWEDQTPLIYISFPTAKDPLRDQMSGGRATIQVIAAYNFDLVKKWQELPWRKRGADYEALKESMKQRLTDALIKTLPQLKDRIAYSELSTPLSTRHFTDYKAGEIYGLEHTPQRFLLRSLRPQTRIKGLFLTGQDIVTVGVGGALYSGVLTATTILKKSVIVRILFGRRLSRKQHDSPALSPSR